MQGYDDIYAKGWDVIRDQRLERQKKLGLLPASTELTPRSPIPHPVASKRIGSMTPDGNNPAWDSLSMERRTDLARRMAVYAGMVSGMDRNVGRLLESISEDGALENTLILFLSDNGACAEWEPYGFDLPIITDPQPGVGINQGTQAAPNVLRRTSAELDELGGPKSSISYGSAWANACATPWRMYKHYCHEAGIGTPLVVHWPAKIKSRGEMRTQVGHIIDVMATFCEVGDAQYPKEIAGNQITPLEGKSLVPAFENQPLERDFLAFEHEGNAAIRVGDWKLVRRGANGPWELYDLAQDRTELHDLAATNRDRVQKTSAQWEDWAKRTHVLPRPGG
jgi:arylsulfatase